MLARQAVRRRPAGIVTDLDGTLAPIADRPEDARVLPEVLEALDRLAGRLAVVAVVTGRAAAAARAMLGEVGEAVLVVGNHGLEWLEPGGKEPAFDASLLGVRERLEELLALVRPVDGVAVEAKGLSATVHYRLAPDPAAARDRILAALGLARSRGIDVREGRMSVELRPADAGDKGSATGRAAARYGLRGLLVCGDDVTDLDMFRTAADLRVEGVTAAIIAVRGGSEVPAEVSNAADVVVDGPRELGELLTALARDPDVDEPGTDAR